jgi:hypothetical protein
MRVSLTARFVSHPSIDFRGRRAGARRLRLGLGRDSTVYQRPLATRSTLPTIGTLRSQTSRFRFTSVGHVRRGTSRRASSSLGLLRARRV